MTVVNLLVGAVTLLAALVLIVLGAVAAAGKLPGNPWFGLRVAEVRRDRATWDHAHKAAGPVWIFGGVALAFGAAFAFIASGWLWVAPVVLIVIAVIAYSVGGNVGARAAAFASAASENAASENGADEVDIDALRRAAGRADEGR
ncbi:SdpI family protein [Corynebacterium timonense]|uniref:SdpI/YhfL protein family protein n=1 Tax=Corynebacterium timonense TaxID=441500 RepID=A0A1H1UIX9_9CORY|nr:SdpI family protein [Corynebacterium timonense]SDS72166.1 SdpI/YhfL protein family protein [Corynebacterium timonense]